MATAKKNVNEEVNDVKETKNEVVAEKKDTLLTKAATAAKANWKKITLVTAAVAGGIVVGAKVRKSSALKRILNDVIDADFTEIAQDVADAVTDTVTDEI